MHFSKKLRETCSTEDFIHPREREYHSLYRAYLFGQFRVFCGSTQIEKDNWRRSKAKFLLGWLILNQGKLFSADKLIDLFWRDLPSETAMRNLHVTIHYLRHILEPNLVRGEKSSYIRRDERNFYWLEKNNAWWTDVCAVEHLWEYARQLDRQGEVLQAESCYRKVVEYCESGFMPETIYEECFQPFRSQYEHIFLESLNWLTGCYLQKKDLDEALGYAYRALNLNPYYEQAICTIVEVYSLKGNITAALRHLEDFQSMFQKDLGLAPSEELEVLFQSIVQGRKSKV